VERPRTEWHQVVLNGDGLAGVAERFLRKGSKVYIEGQLRTRKWQDQSGNDRYSTEVYVGVGGALTMLDGPQGGSGGGGGRSEGGYGGGASGGGFGGGRSAPAAPSGGSDWGRTGGSAGGFAEDLDDDIPF